MFRRDSRVRRIEKVQTRKKLGGNFLFPAPPPFSPAFLFRIFHTFALSPLSDHESLEKASAELAKGWKGKMYFKVGPRRLLEERLWKIHGHNIFFLRIQEPIYGKYNYPQEERIITFLSNDPGKVDSNFFCYAAAVLSLNKNVLIFTLIIHKPTRRPFTQ